jgi:hypothetical protein
MTIGAASHAVPARDEPPPSRPKPRRRDDDDAPRRPAANWKPVDTALGREQVAVVFILVTFIAGVLDLFLSFTIGPFGPDVIIQVFMALIIVGPALVAGVFGLAARATALRAPAESCSKSAAISSLLSAFAALASLIMIGICILLSMDHQRPFELPMKVSVGGVVLATLVALATFIGFVAQVGIAQRSKDVAGAIGRTAVTVVVCLAGMMAISFLYTIVSEFEGPRNHGYGPYGNYGGYYRDDTPFFQVLVGILMPLSFAIVLVLYHRLLAAARRSIRGEMVGQYDG